MNQITITPACNGWMLDCGDLRMVFTDFETLIAMVRNKIGPRPAICMTATEAIESMNKGHVHGRPLFQKDWGGSHVGPVGNSGIPGDPGGQKPDDEPLRPEVYGIPHNLAP